MSNQSEQLEALQDIKTMMARSSRFISLSGLSGVFSGIFALVGAYAAYWKTNSEHWIVRARDTAFGTGEIVKIEWSVVYFLIADAAFVFVLSVGVSYVLTRRKAINNGLPLWGSSSRQMLFNLSIPLLTGAVFCVILFHYGLIGLIAPTTLVFYGLALLNAGKNAFEEINYLGLSEITLGLIGLMMKGQGLLFWAVGFGLLHIIYGIVMYWRHDR